MSALRGRAQGALLHGMDARFYFSAVLSPTFHYNAWRSRPDSRVARKRIEESPGSIGQGAR
jgi:hypothetical protein